LSKKTTEIIIETNNDYVIAVKENQKELYHQIRVNMLERDPVSIDYTAEKNKGRIEERAVFVYDNLKDINEGWKGLKTIIQVERKTQTPKQKKRSHETAYYISSLQDDASEFNSGIRGHWHIENTLHWTKDVVFKEDASKIKTGQAPENLSVIKNWVMTAFRINKYTSMTQAIRGVANDIKLMIKILE